MLYDFIKYYNKLEYNMIKVPCIVPAYIHKITYPEYNRGAYSAVGSAEQSFLFLIKLKLLTNGKYQAITPCLRPDDILDKYHQHLFIKLELIDINPTNPEVSLFNTLLYAYTIMSKYNKVDIIRTKSGYDLEINGIEVGSYGYRECDFCSWVYGTGLALPRFITVCEETNNVVSFERYS